LYQPANTQPIVPGSGTSATNPNNYYATQWILAREAILLRLIDQPPSTADIRDRANTAQAFIDRPAIPVAPVTTGLLQPLEYGSQSNVPVANRYKLEESRFDLAGTSIDEYRDRLETWIQRSAPVSPMPGSDPNWWYDLFCATDRRFHANPFVARPLTAARFAQQAPIFLQGCTQFIVEYAGDFVAQEPATLANGAANPKYGQVTNVYTNTPNGTDGQIDFLVLWDDTNNNGLIDPAEQPSVRRQIRWYGLPRDTNNDNSIPVNCAPGAPANAMPDVVPLRDVWRTATTPGPVTGAPFERFNWIGTAKVSAPTKTPTLKDYAPTGSGSGDYLSTIPTSAMAPDDTYTCAWGPSDPKPKMIRIIITLDDPSSKLADGKTFEFVFTLP
jgi:hypothetical protein